MAPSPRRLLTRVALVATISTVLATVPEASAAPTAAARKKPSFLDRQKARKLYREGDELHEAGRYAEALERMKAAHAIMNAPTTGLEVARNEIALGRLLAGRATLQAIFDAPVEKPKNSVFEEARREAHGMYNDLAARIPSITVRAKPAEGRKLEGLRVRIDGETVPSDALATPRRLDPGKHRVEVNADGHQPAMRQVTLAEHDKRELTISLEAMGGAEGDVPLLPVALVAGGGAAVLTSAILGGVALSQTSDLEAQCPGRVCPPAVEGDLDGARRVAHASTAMLVIGVAAGAAGAVLWALDDGDAPDKGAQRGPVWFDRGVVRF